MSIADLVDQKENLRIPTWMMPLYIHRVLEEVVLAGATAWVGECDCALGTVHITDKGADRVQCECGNHLRLFPISTLEDIATFERGEFRARGLLC